MVPTHPLDSYQVYCLAGFTKHVLILISIEPFACVYSVITRYKINYKLQSTDRAGWATAIEHPPSPLLRQRTLSADRPPTTATAAVVLYKL